MRPKRLRRDPIEPQGSDEQFAGPVRVPLMTTPPAPPNGDTQAAEKAGLRRVLRRARAGIPPQARRQAGTAIRRLALRLRLLDRKRRIGCYIPAKDELDTAPLRAQALRMGVHLYLPIVPPARQRRLGFVREHGTVGWNDNRYGIAEPDSRHRPLRAWALDILFVPLLGFDAQGNRIGMGGGYYDASLAFRHLRRHWRGPLLIGLAFEAQRLERIPADPWDVPLDAILTERGLRWFKHPGRGA